MAFINFSEKSSLSSNNRSLELPFSQPRNQELDSTKRENNNIPFMSGSGRNIGEEMKFTPGPGSYTVGSPFESKLISKLSKAGYYVVFENGKLKKRKQQYYANDLTRLEDSEIAKAPGPGFYHSPSSCFSDKQKNNSKKKAMTFIKRKTQPPRVIEQPEKSTAVGPGSYEIKTTLAKPKVKGVPEWGKSKLDRLPGINSSPKKPQQTPLENDMEEICDFSMNKRETVIHPITKQVNSPFASNVPRFHIGKNKNSKRREIVTLKKEITDRNTSIIIEKTLDIDEGFDIPGPGCYLEESQMSTLGKKGQFSFQKYDRFEYPGMKKGSVLGPGEYLTEDKPGLTEKYKEVLSGVFSSQTGRLDNSTTDSNLPGPGKYMNLIGIAQSLAKKIRGKHAALGGISRRFADREIEEAESSPGPGSYLKNKKTTKKKQNAVFASHTTRGASVTVNISPSVGQYNEKEFNTLKAEKTRIEKGGGNNLYRFLKLNPGSKPVFQSALPRFGKEMKSNIPGPCSYNVKPIESSTKSYISQIANRGSFLMEKYTPGPGSYVNPHAIVPKRSFNIRFASPDPK